MRRNQVQPGADYPASLEASERIERSHRKLAGMVNANPKEVIVGHSTTMNVYVLANALKPSLKAGDEVVVTNLDHEANIGAWRRLQDIGVVVREWKTRHRIRRPLAVSRNSSQYFLSERDWCAVPGVPILPVRSTTSSQSWI